jgi:hypothetical protein
MSGSGHVWMAPSWQGIFFAWWIGGLAVMCPAC